MKAFIKKSEQILRVSFSTRHFKLKSIEIMISYILKSSLLLIFWTSLWCNDTCLAVHRVIRSTNSSQSFQGGEMNPENHSAIEELPACVYTNDSQSEYDERSKRSIVEVSTIAAENVSSVQYDEKFLNCLKTNVEFGCYEILPNKSALVPIYERRQFRPTQYYISPDNNELHVCPEFFDEYNDETKFSEAFNIVTIVGTVISFVCIVLHVAMFITLKKLRNLPGYCLFSLCISLLIAYMCTFLTTISTDCTANGVIKAFSYLASFFWMNVMSYDIWRSLRIATSQLRLTADKPMLARFAMYSAYAWGLPFLIIVIGLIVDSSSESDMEYGLSMHEDSCWFRYKKALAVYFAMPLVILLFCNVVLFVLSFYMITSATMKKDENKADLWSRFLLSFRLCTVMGLLWLFGLMAAVTEVMFVWYLYVLFNVFQGVFIFFSFTFTEKTRRECKKALAKKKSSTMKTQVSSQQSSSV